MDTRRMPGYNAAIAWPAVDTFAGDVEVVEIRHIERPIRGLIGKLTFLAFVALLVAAIAVIGMPERSSWYIPTPLPNFFSFNIAF